MGARLRLWWEKIKTPLEIIAIILVLVLLVALIILIVQGYRLNWDWVGLGSYTTPKHPSDTDFQRGKTLWDWLQLLIIPFVLAVGGYLFNYSTSRNERNATERHNQVEREIAQDNQSGATLQEYINKMSELLLHEKLRESQPEDEVRSIARVRTLTVLSLLDEARKRTVLQFLYESGLITKDKSVIDLSSADFSKALIGGLDLPNADLSSTNLIRANLIGAKLTKANLSNAMLFGANLASANLTGANLKNTTISIKNYGKHEPIITNLYNANLTDANLSDAHLNYADLGHTKLTGADLTGADLLGAKITDRQQAEVRSLKGARLPDGFIHS